MVMLIGNATDISVLVIPLPTTHQHNPNTIARSTSELVASHVVSLGQHYLVTKSGPCCLRTETREVIGLVPAIMHLHATHHPKHTTAHNTSPAAISITIIFAK